MPLYPANPAQNVNSQSGATYTPVAKDVNNVVVTTYAGLVTITLPSDTNLPSWQIGRSIRFYQSGRGQVVFVAGSGASITALSTLLRTKGPGAWVTVWKVAANTYSVTGDLSAPQAVFPSRLSASGRNLVDANGFVMPKLKGFNVQPVPWAQSHYNDMATLGAKIQRLVVFWDALEPSAGSIDTTTLVPNLDTSIARAQAAGIYTVLSIHLNVNRVPAWAYATFEASDPGNGHFYETESCYLNGQNMTAYLADRYGNPAGAKYTTAVIGIGLNEPPIAVAAVRNADGSVPWMETRQRQMLTWARVNGNAPSWVGIVGLAYGSQTPIFDVSIGQNNWTNADPTAYDSVGGNVMYDLHYYFQASTSASATDDGRLANGMPWPTSQGGTYIGAGDTTYPYASTALARSQQAAFIKQYKNFCNNANIPLMVGEWGWPATGPSLSAEEGWINDVIPTLNDASPVIEMEWVYDVSSGNDTYAARPNGYAFRNSTQIWMGAAWARDANVKNESYVNQGPGFATDTYIVGSAIAVPANLPAVGTRYRLRFSISKTAAGTAAPVLSIRIGAPTIATVTNKALTSNVATLTTSAAHGFTTGQTAGVAISDATFNGSFTIASTPTSTTFTYAKTAANVTSTAASGTATRPAGSTADPALLTFTFGAGTAAVDTGVLTLESLFRTVGPTTTAVIAGAVELNESGSGIASSAWTQEVTSAGFDSTVTNLVIGASWNGGASAAHTIQLVTAELVR